MGPRSLKKFTWQLPRHPLVLKGLAQSIVAPVIRTSSLLLLTLLLKDPPSPLVSIPVRPSSRSSLLLPYVSTRVEEDPDGPSEGTRSSPSSLLNVPPFKNWP